MGKDLEKTLDVINRIKDEAARQINSLSLASNYRIETEEHTHPGVTDSAGDGGHTHNVIIEKVITYEMEKPLSASVYVSPIVSIGGELSSEKERLQTLESKNYCDIHTLNNQYGSPWTEVYNLKDKIDEMESYANSFSDIKWIGEKFSLISLMQVVLSYAVDARWAITYYHNYIQEGVDNVYNDNIPSVTWPHHIRDSGETKGNVQQTHENVHVKNPPLEIY